VKHIKRHFQFDVDSGVSRRFGLRNSTGLRQAGLFLAAGLLVASIGAGCTSHKEKAQKVIREAVELCKKAEPDGPFYELELFDGNTDEILHLACNKKIEKFEIEDNLLAWAYTGPVRWNAQLAKETGVWTLSGVEWSDLKRARRALDADDPSEQQLTYAIDHLKDAQAAVPESSWIRLRRLEALLKLRMDTRSQDTPKPATIGPKAQTQFDETLAWAKKKSNLSAQVEARYLVVEHLRDYLGRVEMILSSDGTSDEWLIKSIEQAEKEGKPEKAEAYRKELELTRKKREKAQKIFSAREVKVRDALCQHVGKLSPAGLDDDELQKRVIATKEAVDCMKRAPKKPASVAEAAK
jgi:hypothetical protein